VQPPSNVVSLSVFIALSFKVLLEVPRSQSLGDYAAVLDGEFLGIGCACMRRSG
jgi:hypothetical protein